MCEPHSLTDPLIICSCHHSCYFSECVFVCTLVLVKQGAGSGLKWAVGMLKLARVRICGYPECVCG